MNENTIKAIQELAATSTPPDTDIPAMPTPPGWDITSLERFMETPARHRNIFHTTDLSSFIDYIATQEADEASRSASATVYVNQHDMTAMAIFDHGTPDKPGWGAHRALLKAEKTPEYAALTSRNALPYNQQEFIDWIQDWDPHIRFIDQDGEPMPTGHVIAAVRRLTVQAKRQATTEVGEYNREKSALEQVEITQAKSLPARMYFSCEPYQHMENRQFQCRLYARTSDEPQILYRIIGLERKQLDIAQEMTTRIADNTPSYIYLGTATHQKQ